MEENTTATTSKGNRLLSWLKDPHNLAIVLVILIALIIRLYYFSITYNQPVWWDEADYLDIAKHWTIGMDYPVNVIRPIFLPLIISGFYLLGLGEISIRIFILLCSVLSIFFIYLLGKMFFNKTVGIISAILLSGFWSFTFFSYRVLVDVPLTFFWLSCIYSFFYAYSKNKSWKYFILPGILLGLSFLTKFTSAVLVLIFGIYLISTERLSLFKNKGILVFAVSSLLTVLPFFIWEKIKYGSFFAFYATTAASTVASKPWVGYSFFQHLTLSGKFLIFPLSIILLLTFVWFLFEYLLVAKSSFKKDSIVNKSYFLLLWFFISVLMFAWLMPSSDVEERYYFIFYPAIFLIIGKGLTDFYNLTKKYNKIFAAIFLLGILLFAIYPNLQQADNIIQVKKSSFLELKQAGTWINQHTTKDESFLVVEESAETVYYAERKYNIEWHNIANKTDLLNRIKIHEPSYMVLSFYYYLGRNDGGKGSIEVLQYVFSNPEIFPVVQTYGPYIDEQKTLPLVVIVKINKDKINI